ncbi:hypothetical protein BGZ83_009878 [Gryganskiella cystojenkinii]|nr:hypothetical protein BGZ83_009878 [Gryganskiella cystojenkinii]
MSTRIKTSKVIKSPFAAIALAAKKAISPSTRTNDRSLSNGLAAVFVEYSNLPTPNAVAVPAVAPNTLASTANPALILQPAALSQNIFPKNIFRTAIDVLLPEIGDRIVNTTQLVACVGLLAKSSLPVSPLSTIPTLSLSSPVQLEWLHAMEEHPLEKEHLGLLMNHMVGIFIQHPSKDSETVQEVVLLGPVLDKEHYRKLLNCFLRELQGTTVLEVGLLRGLVQLVQDAPPYCLQADDLTQILRIVRRQLEDPARQNEEYIVHLMLAITTILVIMADHKIRDLNREQEHGPLLKVLSGLRKHKDPFVKYQAEYAYQALLLVPDDESTLQEFRRHALGLTSGLLNISGVIKLDFGGIIDNLPVVIGGGRGIFDLLKEALGPGNKDPWYLAVREAEKMVQEGRLSDLNQWICDAPCSQDPKFQWGVCQLLGEITIDPSWDELTRGQAIGFLGDMFRITSVSKHQKGVKSWILTMLHQILNLTDSTIMSESVKIRVRQLICELEKANEAFLYSYPLRGRLPLPRSFALLKEVNDKPDINLVLDRLRRQRWDGFNKQAVYIEPLSKPSLQATSDIIVPLRERVAKFLESKGEVMLILGDSGAGKSTFHQRLEHKLWEEYRAGKPIPLFIDLKSIENPDKDMIHQHLEEYKIFSNLQIDELRRSQQFILICDGYDECRNWSNISANNRFNQLHQWKAKMVITCRTQYLNPNYRGYFEPQTPPPNSRSCPELFEEAVIVPFKTDQIQEYIDLYTASPETQEIFGSQPVWTSSQYMQRLKGTMNLMELIKNPFMLRMVLDTLPRIAISTTCLTRAEIYDEFVELHFENEQRRLVQQKSGGKMERDCSAAFGQLEGEDFILLGIDFSKRLSEAIFKELNGVNSVDYSVFADEGTWKDQFFGPDPRAKLLRESSQLVSRAKNQDSGLLRNKNSLVRKRNAYEFNHRSILEYFFSCLVYDPRGNPSRLNISNCLASASRPSPLVAHPLGQQNMTSEQSIIQFLAERVQNSTEFKDQLLSIVQLSRKDAAVSPAAANAMSILVRAGIIFNGADLRGIRIPGANLSGGHFDSAHMQDADLNGVNFTSAWLRQVDFTRASMKDVWFGEKPSLDAKNSSSCASSTDGKFFAQGLYTGVIHVYDTTNWTIRNTFDQHSSGVSSLAFSRDGNYLASSASNTMHIWRLQGQAGDQSCIVLEDVQGKGHITHVAISPDGHRALSVDLHGYVRIWDIDSGTLAWRNSYINNGDRVYSAAWSADGLRIALGFNNGKISLWKSANGDFDQVVAETKSLSKGHLPHLSNSLEMVGS